MKTKTACTTAQGAATGSRRRAAPAAIAAALTMACYAASPALAAEHGPRRPGGGGAPPPTAQSSAPASARVRNLLLAYHGTSKGALDGSSGGVSAILRGFIANPAESMAVRRQAARALHWYPSEENLTFIADRLAAAPLALQTPFVEALSYFAAGRESRVADLVRPLIASPHVTVRHAAVSLAEKIGPELLRGSLESRLPGEQDPAVRRAIRRVLQGTR